MPQFTSSSLVKETDNGRWQNVGNQVVLTDQSGDYVDVTEVTVVGNDTYDQEFDLIDQTALGNIEDSFFVHKFGRNTDVDTTEDVWTVGGLRTWLTTAATLEAISTDADDTAAGAGLRSIIVDGLDENLNFYTETILMNGLSASTATTGKFFRVNRVKPGTVGTYGGNNQGQVTIRVSGGGTTMAELLAGEGQTEQTHYSIATGYKCLLYGFYISTDGTKVIDARILQRNRIGETSGSNMAAVRKVWGITGLQGPYDEHLERYPMTIEGATDLWWEVTPDAINTEVEAGFYMKIVRDA